MHLFNKIKSKKQKYKELNIDDQSKSNNRIPLGFLKPAAPARIVIEIDKGYWGSTYRDEVEKQMMNTYRVIFIRRWRNLNELMIR